MTGESPDAHTLADGDFDLGAGLGSEMENPALRRMIVDEIRANGPMTFRRFMELALYHASEGYYTGFRERIGRAGDYVTSPEVSPLFGYAIARQLAELWRCLGQPGRFTIVEYGAGTGRLAGDILRWTQARHAEFHSTLVYRLVERSPSLRAIQHESLSHAAFAMDSQGAQIQIAENTDDLSVQSLVGCILANELIDSFPVHRVTFQDGKLREVYVVEEGGELRPSEGGLSSSALSEYFARLGLLPAEGCVAEVNLAGSAWMRSSAALLQGGYLLVLDYGYPAARLYAPWRRSGTLLCYHRHEASEDPYRYIGRQDITSHVDFTSLLGAAGLAGLVPLGCTDQAHFLAHLGIGGSVPASAAGAEALGEYYARRRAVEALIDPSGLGRIRVLLLGRNAPARGYSGFGEIAHPATSLS